MRQKLCGKCGHPWNRPGLVSCDATCNRCGGYLHVCQNCVFYDALAKQGCRQKDGEPGPTPSSKNFCDQFIFKEMIIETKEDRNLDRRSAERRWKDLFRD